MTRDPFVSIIIPVFRDWKKITQCIERLSEQTYSSEFFEVLIVDNDKEDRVRPGNIPHSKNVRYIAEHLPGSYAARNKGLAEAAGEIIGFTDADCIPERDWIEQGVGALIRNPEFPRLGGRIKIVAAHKESPRIAEIYERYLAFPQADYVQRLRACATANMFTWKKVFEKVGEFDSRRYSGGDIEWGRRAEAAGFRIQYSPKTVVAHRARREYRELTRKAKRVGGGQYMGGWLSFLSAHVAIVLALLPPLGKAAALWRQRGPWRHRILALVVHFHLRFIQSWMRLKLAYGARPPRQ